MAHQVKSRITRTEGVDLKSVRVIDAAEITKILNKELAVFFRKNIIKSKIANFFNS